MLTVEEFYANLMADRKASAMANQNDVEKEFLRYGLSMLEENGEIDQYDLIESGCDGAGAWRVDAYSIDANEIIGTDVLTLFISNFDGSEIPENLIQTDLGGLFKKLKRFVEFSLEKNIYTFFEPGSNIFDLANEVKDYWKRDEKSVRFVVLSNKPASKRIKNLDPIDVAGVKAETIVWDLKRFFDLELSGLEREELVLNFEDRPIKALLTSDENSTIRSYLAVMPATTLVRIYEKWGARLLEQNVRSFLSARGKVNKGIRETIKEEPEMFFAYNNGLTTTALEVVSELKEDGLYITELKNFQIVNGGQTTASLFAASKKDKCDISKINIQMKLSVVDPEMAEQIVPRISRYANSQNKVSEADLFSNAHFHVRFEEFSRKIIPPVRSGEMAPQKWFYERARGQYVNEMAYLSASERKGYQQLHPKSQVITKTDLAKYLTAFNLEPQYVSKGATICFSKFSDRVTTLWQLDESNFNEEYFKESIAKSLIYKTLEKLVSAQRDSWYSGHRDKIVPYTIAAVCKKIISEGKNINFPSIWRRQEVHSSLQNLLISVAEKINDMLNDPSREYGNVAEYAKREIFWERVQQYADSIDTSTITDALVEIEVSSARKGASAQFLEMEAFFKAHATPEVMQRYRSFLVQTGEDKQIRLSIINSYRRYKKLSLKQINVIYPTFAAFISGK